MMRRLLRRPNLYVVREELAAQYLRGDGIEIGALNAPLPLPPGARARYVDQRTPTELTANDYLGVVDIKVPDIIADVETLAGIDDRSQDFVIANHVLVSIHSLVIASEAKQSSAAAPFWIGSSLRSSQ